MVISSDGNFAHGEDPADIAEWLRAHQAGGYPVDRVVVSVCKACGDGVFRVVVDDGSSGAYRTCVKCGETAYIADSDEYWMDEDAEPISCPCGGKSFEVAVSFSMYSNGEDVRMVCVGVRCLADGMLGSPADWNIRDHPSLHLIDRV